LIDLNGVANTADWGLHATGTFGGGLVSYAASVVDGAGYKTPQRSKRPDFEGRISVVPVKGLTLAVGAYTGKEGKDTQAVENNVLQTTNTFSRYNAAVVYVASQFRVGVEYYSVKNFTNVVITAATPETDKQHGVSGFAGWNFLPNASVFARYDDTKLHTHETTQPSQEDTKKYLQAGVSYSPRKNVDFALVYKNTKTDADYTTATNTAVKTNEIGVFSQVKF
jgi:predicted porin